MVHPFKHWLMLAALVILWGSAFFALKIAVTSLPGPVVVMARLVIGVALLAPLAAAMGLRMPTDWRTLGFVLAMAAVGNAIPFSLIAWGQQAVPSSIAGILMAVVPLAIIVLAHVFLPDERLNRRKALGFVTGFVGVVVLFAGPGASEGLGGAPDARLRALAILTGALGYAANTIISRRMPVLHPVASASLVLLVAAFLVTPFGLPQAIAHQDPIPVPAILAVTALGLFSTGLATIIYYALIRAAGASFFAVTNYLVPLWAVSLGNLVAGEAINLRIVMALGLVLVGIAVSQQDAQKTQPDALAED